MCIYIWMSPLKSEAAGSQHMPGENTYIHWSPAAIEKEPEEQYDYV